MQIITPDQLPAGYLLRQPIAQRGPGNPRSRAKTKYIDLVTAFDIETSRLPDIDQSVMYVWQWAFGEDYCVIGRSWDEFRDFLGELTRFLKKGTKLVCYVHNLSYEFHFLRGILNFDTADIFALKERKILKASYGHIEFRCAYLHSNMSLAEYLKKMRVPTQKLTYDYNIIRYPWTPLTQAELDYCAHDVIGLVQAIKAEMELDGDNLYSIPLTSTGYVRRNAKRAMREVSHTYVQAQLPDLDTFRQLRAAFRGGDCHANRYYAGEILRVLHSADRSSSYPDVICNCEYPVGPFYQLRDEQSMDAVMDLITRRHKAVLMTIGITGLRLRDPLAAPMPYLSRDKCEPIRGGEWDNGRILAADYLETTITDVDLRIILREYTWEDIRFLRVSYARYGRLPHPLIEEVIKYYRAKTELKNVPGQEVQYDKSKALLNSLYGMMAQNPVRRSMLYTQEGTVDQWGHRDLYAEDTSIPDDQLLVKANRRAFLCYQWGCWVTAWARYRLREGIWLVQEQGAEPIYCDTDSVKYLGEVDWTLFNRQREAASRKSGAWATDPQGEDHYMGVFEQERDMMEFRTWGAKKYAALYLGKAGEPELVCTIAGVAKTAGSEELAAAGGLPAFTPDYQFTRAGGLEAVYNDWTYDEREVDGHRLIITPNVCLRPSSYTLGVAADYRRLLRNYRATIDF